MNGPCEQMISNETSALFIARRNTAGIRVGDRVIIQTHAAGEQVEALVMGTSPGGFLIRFSRWTEVFAVPLAAVLRLLPRDLAA